MQREAGLQACPAFIVFELMLACCSVRGLHPPHAAPQEVMFQTIDEGVWDEKYADKFGTLPYGVALKQGPRPEMEDFTHIIPRARCGFLFAGATSPAIGGQLRTGR